MTALGLAEGGVHAPVFRVDLQGQRIHVGGFELGELAVFQDHIHHGVLSAHFIQHARRGGVMTGGGLACLGRVGTGAGSRRALPRVAGWS